MAKPRRSSRSLAQDAENPLKSAIAGEPVSQRNSESRSPSRKMMCRQRHSNDSRGRETLILSCPTRPYRHPCSLGPCALKKQPPNHRPVIMQMGLRRRLFDAAESTRKGAFSLFARRFQLRQKCLRCLQFGLDHCPFVMIRARRKLGPKLFDLLFDGHDFLLSVARQESRPAARGPGQGPRSGRVSGDGGHDFAQQNGGAPSSLRRLVRRRILGNPEQISPPHRLARRANEVDFIAFQGCRRRERGPAPFPARG